MRITKEEALILSQALDDAIPEYSGSFVKFQDKKLSYQVFTTLTKLQKSLEAYSRDARWGRKSHTGFNDIIKKYTMGNKCTSCGKKSTALRYEHKKNINGEMIDLIPKGEYWCPSCCKKKGLQTLSDINEQRKK